MRIVKPNTLALKLSVFFPQQGFWKSQAYIATQYPLEDTTNDFWRMVWQEHCRSVVMLVSKEELQQVRWFCVSGEGEFTLVLLIRIAWRDKLTSAREGGSFNIYKKMIFFSFCGKREKGFPYPYGLYLQRRALTDTIVFCEAGKRTLRFYKMLVLSRGGKKKRP